MLVVYCQWIYFNSFSERPVFIRQNLTSSVFIKCLLQYFNINTVEHIILMVSALKGLNCMMC